MRGGQHERNDIQKKLRELARRKDEEGEDGEENPREKQRTAKEGSGVQRKRRTEQRLEAVKPRALPSHTLTAVTAGRGLRVVKHTLTLSARHTLTQAHTFWATCQAT